MTSISLVYADLLYYAQRPKFEGLDYWTKIIRKAKKLKEKFKNIDNSTQNNWSVLSDRYSQVDESDDSDDFASRLADLDRGTKLKRRSTMVSQYGYDKPRGEQGPKKSSFNKAKCLNIKETIEEATVISKSSQDQYLENIPSKENKFDSLLKGGRNKRKLASRNIRSEAFWFLNQLGKKLRYAKRKTVSHAKIKTKSSNYDSMGNNRVSSESSDYDSQDNSNEVNSIAVPMSPIKRRKDIISPNLNNEQSHFLQLCSIYKSDDFLSFNNVNTTHQRNASQTPVDRTELVSKNMQNEDAKSCAKLDVRKRDIAKESNTITSQEDSLLNIRYKPAPSDKMIKLSFADSPSRLTNKRVDISPKKKVKKVKKKRVRIGTIVSDNQGKV